MEFFRRAAGNPSRIGVFPAAFHPPTRAHLAVAQAALGEVDEVLFVLPQRFPHKKYETVRFEDRLELILTATAEERRFSVAASDGGLFIEIARECRAAYGDRVELWFLCGRDAAERIVNWDYGDPGAFRRQLEEFGLLVADREGPYEPPPGLRHRIRRLRIDAGYNDVSATRVREGIQHGGNWRDLVPPSIADRVGQLYGGK